MQVTTFDKFSLLMTQNSEDLESCFMQENQEGKQLYEILSEENNVEQFEIELRNTYCVEINQRKRIYQELLSEFLFPQLQKDIVGVLLFIFIFEQLSPKDTNKKLDDLDYSSELTQNLFEGKLSSEEIIQTLTKSISDLTSINLSKEETTNIVKLLKSDQSGILSRICPSENVIPQEKSLGEEDLKMVTKSKQFKEKLQNMESDWKRYFPGSFEAAIQQCLICVFKKKYKLTEENCSQKVKNMMQIFEKDPEFKIVNKDSIESSIKKICEIQKNIDNNVDVDRNINTLLSEVKNLKKLVIIFDVFELERLILKGNRSKQKIKDTDGILVMGKTGAGKTTNILKFLGNSFKKVMINGEPIFEPDGQLDQDHESFHTSYSAVSCTSIINAAQLKKSMQSKIKRQKRSFAKPLWIIDTPGFDDTRGYEYQIANQVGTIRALQNCHSIRLVFLLPNSAITEKGNGIRSMLKTIKDLCSDYFEVEASVSFFVNRIMKQISDQAFSNMIDNLLQNKEANCFNEVEVKILENIKEACENNCFLNPIVEDTSKYQAHLASIMKTQPISHANIKDSFKSAFTRECKSQIQIYLLSCFDQIKSLFKQQKYEKALYQFDNLKTFVKLIQNEQEDDSFDNSVLISQSGLENSVLTTNKYNRQVNQVHDFFFQEVNKIFSKLQSNMNKVIMYEESQEFYENGDKFINKIKSISAVFGKRIPELKGLKQIKGLISDCGQKLKVFFQKAEDCNIQKFSRLLKKYIEHFKLSELLDKILNQKEKEFQSELKAVQSGLKENIEEISQDQIKKITFLSNILNSLRQNHSSVIKINILKRESDLKYEGSLSDIKKLLNEKISSQSIKRIMGSLLICENLIKIDIVSNSLEKQKEKNDVIQRIKRTCEEKIRKICWYAQKSEGQELFSEKSIKDIQNIISDIDRLIEISFVKAEHEKYYLQILSEMQGTFNDNLKILRQIEEIDILQASNLESYEDYIKKMKKTIEKVVKYARVISEEDQINKELQKLVTSLLRIFNIELAEINNKLVIGLAGVKYIFPKLQPILKRIKSQKAIVFDSPPFEPLKNKIKQIFCTLEEKICAPLKEYLQQAKQNYSKKGVDYFKIGTDSLENIIIYLDTVDRQTNWFERKDFLSLKGQTENFIKENLIDKLGQSMKQFNYNLEIKMSQEFVNIVKILVSLQAKPQIEVYLARQGFSIEEQIKSIKNRFEDYYRDVEQKTKDEETNLEKLFQQVRQIRDIERLVSSEKQFDQISSIIKKTMIERGRCYEKAILQIINDDVEHDMGNIFGELEPILIELKDDQSQATLDRIKFIVNELTKCAEQLSRDIRKHESSSAGKYFGNEDDQQYLRSTSKFLKLCKNVIVFEKQMQKMPIKDTKLKEKSLKIINKKFVHEKYQKLTQIFDNQRRTLCDLFSTFDFSKIKKRSSMIFEFENCFRLYEDSTKNYRQKIRSCKLDLFKFCQKMKNDDGKEPITKEQLEQLTIFNFLKIIFKELDRKTQKKYQHNIEMNIDSNFAIYFDSCQPEVKAQITQKVEKCMGQKVEKYNRQGNYEDQQFKAIQKQINLLPTKIRNECQKKLQSNKISFEKSENKKMEKVFVDLQSKSSGLKEFLDVVKEQKLPKKLYSKYCSNLDQHLNEVSEKSIQSHSMFGVIDKYFVNSRKQTINLKSIPEVKIILNDNLRILIGKIKIEVQNHYQQIYAELNDSTFSENVQENINGTIQNLFFIAKEYTSKKEMLICSDPSYQNIVISEWNSGMNKMVNVLKNKVLEKNADNFLNEEELTLRRYFEHVHKNSKILEMIKENKKKIKSTEILKTLSEVDEIPGEEVVCERFKEKLHEKFDFLKKFEFINNVRHNQTVNQMTQEFEGLSNLVEGIDKKIKLFDLVLSQKNGNIESNFTSIKNDISGKFDRLVKNVEEQIQYSFEQPNGERVKYVNIFLNISQSLKQTNSFIIPQSKLEANVNKIEDDIKQKFVIVKKNTQNVIEQVEKEMSTTQKKCQKIQLEYYEKVKGMKNECKKKNQVIEETSKKKLQQQLPKCATNEEKQNLQKRQKGIVETAINLNKKQLQDTIIKLNQELKQSIKSQNEKSKKLFSKLTKLLILYQKNIMEINEVDSSHKTNFNIIMTNLQSKEEEYVENLMTSLKGVNDFNSYSSFILQKYKVFENYTDLDRQEQTKKQDIDYVVKNLGVLNSEFSTIGLKGEQIRDIRQLYDKFSKKYEEVISLYQSQPNSITLNDIKSKIKEHGEYLKTNFYIPKPREGNSKEELLASILALYGILKATTNQQHSKTSSKKKKPSIIFRPHEIQVAALLLLLGIARDKKQKLADRMAEVGTGEGKSIILASLCSYLALVGFDVRCACYSMYLSERDGNIFKVLFQFLDIDQKIRYGTFNNICEEILDTGRHNFKKQVKQMMLESPNKFTNKIAKFLSLGTNADQNEAGTPTILLIDEADVFFANDFYGQCYRPAFKLRDESIENLLKYIWSKMKGNPQNLNNVVKDVEKSSDFTNLVKKYPALEKILTNQLHAMVQGASGYKHDYFILDTEKKLVYKQNDSINERLSYGYKTIFANIYEYERGKVSKANLDKALCVDLIIAEFAYAVLPQFFKHIIGVTGTLRAMPVVKKKILWNNYKVKDNFILPSSFGINEKRIYNYFQVEEQKYYEKIVERIKNVKDKRPIIIFFESATVLYDFYNHSVFEEYRKTSTYILTEEHAPCQRERNVMYSTHADTISLMTKSFGRGTDFQVCDQNVKENGGLHIIQAFLSHEQAEQIQIKGRTNRQNSKGSVDIIFRKIELQPLNITQDLKTASLQVTCKTLSKARQMKASNQHDNIMEFVKTSDQKHAETSAIYSNKKLKQKDHLEYIYKINETQVIGNTNVRTAVAIDGTGSMSGAIAQVVSILRETFSKTKEILEYKKCTFLVQISLLVYRNYNSDASQFLQSTPFESDLSKLSNFLSTVRASGGWNYEAVEAGLQAMNKLEDLSQGVLIGDAGGNTHAEIPTMRNHRGEQYWVSKGFPKTTQEAEIQIFKKNECPVHTCYMGHAKNAFNKISQQTKGEYIEFPLGKPNASDIMSNLLVKNILILGEKKLASIGIKNTGLVAEFHARYS